MRKMIPSRIPPFEPAFALASLTARRSFMVGLITLISLMLIGGGVSASMIAPLEGLFGAGLAVLVIAIAAIDARCFRIPDELSLLILLLGVLRNLGAEPGGLTEILASSAFRGIGFALPLLCLRELYRRLRGRDGLGLGDVKLAAAGGIWLDWFSMPLAIEIAALSALSFSAVRQLLSGQPVRFAARLPFGLFLAPAIWVSWLLEAARW
jgi:leader peptidase (prepilin peptidase) / N-methyltransferase